MYSVSEMYDSAVASDVLLLSNYSSSFWSVYTTNHSLYDALFNRMFYSFRYFFQKEGESITTVRDRFIADVKRHLTINDKKYSQLYRVYLLNDSDIPLSEFKTTETMDRDGTFNKGARTDNNTSNIGSQNNSTTNKVSPYDSETFANDTSNTYITGARVDSSSYTSGSQSDSSTEDYTKEKEGYTDGVTKGLNKHNSFWSEYEFIEYIFRDIEKNLLLV